MMKTICWMALMSPGWLGCRAFAGRELCAGFCPAANRQLGSMPKNVISDDSLRALKFREVGKIKPFSRSLWGILLARRGKPTKQEIKSLPRMGALSR